MLETEKLDEVKGSTHFLTVAVEDYFHATTLNPLVRTHHWDRMESRVRQNTERTLDLLAKHQCKATFFVLGWVAERFPDVPRIIFEAGHEVACKGYDHCPIFDHTPESFREDARRAKRAIEKAIGHRVLGYRVPEGHFRMGDLWALRVLHEEGFAYDSSIYPRLRSIASEPWRRFPHRHRVGDGEILEFPLSTIGPSGFLLPAAGGNYIRQLPSQLMRQSFKFWHERYKSPFNMYFHVWELDPDLPRIAAASPLKRIRQYRHVERMPELLAYYFRRYQFTSIARHMGVEQEPILDALPPSERAPLAVRVSSEPRQAITVVIPCFNEARTLPYLGNTLRELSTYLGDHYEVAYVIVDDCSTDDTWALLNQRFGNESDTRLVRHAVNRGVAGAIMTGIEHASTEIVCSIDADCTYDPKQLRGMIPLLADDVAMVTASPYHSEGRVLGVPEWRLFLSRNLSRLYASILRHRFATYTACFRVYRRSSVQYLQLDNGGFLGVAEMLIRLDLAGQQLVECPATLETRLFGASKMKTLHTVGDHLKLIAHIPALKREVLAASARAAAQVPQLRNDL